MTRNTKAAQRRKYQRDWARLNTELCALACETGDLTASFDKFQAHQVGSGFIRGGLESVLRFNFTHPENHARQLRIQYNPERATRFRGAGRQVAPTDQVTVNEGCFLCRENISWQQEGRQLGFDLEVNTSAYTAWMNPFPLLPSHVVVASRQHRGQEWSLHPEGDLDPDRILSDLVSLAARLPGYAGFYNGVGGGASIAGHMHYQFFRPPPGHDQFPLEIAAIAARQEYPGQGAWRLGRYPLEAMHWHGSPEEVLARALPWVAYWADHQDRIEELTANILTLSDPDGPEISLFFVPRDRSRCQSSCMSGIVGGLEVLGELVFSTEEDKRLLDEGVLDYFNLEQVLGEVCTPLNVP